MLEAIISLLLVYMGITSGEGLAFVAAGLFAIASNLTTIRVEVKKG